MVGKELRELYNNVEKYGCDKECGSCELFLKSRNECIFEAKKKWEIWTKQESERFGEFLTKQVKENKNVSKSKI